MGARFLKEPVSGYICKRSTKKKGRIYYAQLVYHDEDGNRIRETIRLANEKDKSRAAVELTELIEKKKRELMLAATPAAIDFGDGMVEWARRQNQVRRSTASIYARRASIIKRYFSGRRAVELGDLTAKDLASFYKWLQENGRMMPDKNGNTGLAYETVCDIKRTLHVYLAAMVDRGVIKENVAAKTRVKKEKKAIEKVDTVQLTLTTEEAKGLLDFCRDTETYMFMYPMLKLAVYYGLRRSEMLGLKWDAIDFDKKTLMIKHTVVRTSGNDVECKDSTKSRSSRRTYPLLESVEDVLIETKEKRKQQGTYAVYGYVFLDDNGKIYDPNYITRKFRKLIRDYVAHLIDVYDGEDKEEYAYRITQRFKGFHFHLLRHTCCSLLFEEGYSLDAICQWLGHADSEVTKNVYLHLTAVFKQNVCASIDGKLG